MTDYVTSISNLGWTVTNGTLSSVIGKTFDTIQSKLANDGRDEKCKFYWDYGAGGKIVNVLARTVVGGAVSAVVNEGKKALKKVLIGGDKNDTSGSKASEYLCNSLKKIHHDKKQKYGVIYLDGLNVSGSMIKDSDGNMQIRPKYVAYDDWGEQCVDALILYAPTANEITYIQNNFVVYVGGKTSLESSDKELVTKNIIWHDTTAIINVSSDKNVILTRVQGRDYSRKELVSNGDINISVSGHITSQYPDVYPTEEVQKFRQLMTYKGLVRVNNEILDQWGIDKIVIKSFSLPSSEGKKSVQDYSFEAVGVQPASEANVTEDTVLRINYEAVNKENETTAEDSLSWKNMLKSKLEGIKQNTLNTATGVLALAEGFVDDAMCKNE